MGSKSLSAIAILCLGLTLPACVTVPTQKSPVRKLDKTEISRKYTYWIEMTSLTVEDDQNVPRTGQITPLAMRDQSRKIYIPFFAIDEGKFEIPLKAWRRDSAEKTSALPDRLYADRDLTVEDNVIDLARGFQKSTSAAPGDALDRFHHTVYGQLPSAVLVKAEFKITRQPNQFANQTEADLALFDRRLMHVFVRDAEDSDGPLTFLTRIGKRLAGTLVDLLLFVDRIVAKPRSVTTPDYLERISQPSSRFYADYTEYKEGRITEYDLIRRLPHVAMIGDSLTKNMYISSNLSLVRRARTEQQKNWFLDTDNSPGGIYSLYERLAELTPMVAVDHASAGARVDSGRTKDTPGQIFAKIRNLSQQVDQILEEERFPDLTLIWIGHNNLNWVAPLDADERKAPEKHLLRALWRFTKHYRDQLERLVDRAKKEKHKTAIVVYGLGNIEAFFRAKETAEVLKAKDPELFPYLEKTFEMFESARPEHRNNTIRLGLMVNEALRDVVNDLKQQLKDYPNVRMRYSDAFASADFNRIELYHPNDAWHASLEGHNFGAEIVFRSLSEDLAFLGIHPK